MREAPAGVAEAEAGQATGLTAAEAMRFHREGWLGPYTLCSEADMARHGEAIGRMLQPRGDETLPEMIRRLNPHMQRGFGLHHRQRLIFDLATDDLLVDRVSSLLGDDLLLWRTMFFNKEPGEKPIPWHQDFDDWPIEPYLAVSAWIAVDTVSRENGCMYFIPGSHRRYYPMVETGPDVLDGFPRMSDPRAFSEDGAVAVELRPGQYVLFNERLLHRSGRNGSDRRRLGMAVRFIPPLVRILDDNDSAVLLRGRDRLGFNRLVAPPAP